jgi:hypothetical protein
MLSTLALVVHTTIGLLLAMAGWYSTWLVLPVTLAATVGSWPWISRATPTRSIERLPTALAVVVALGILGYSSQQVGQHVFTRRDPGSYLTTARWLAEHGELRVDVSSALLDDVPEISFGGPAVYEVEPGIVEFQFSHGATISMATAFDLAGPRGLFASSAAIGALALLAVYLALTTVTRSAWLALAGTAALGISLPLIHATRATYSEPFVLLLMMMALAVLLADGRYLRRSQLTFVGMVVGATTLFRIDAQLYVIGLIALASVLMVRGTRVLDVAAMLGAAAVPVIVGVVDVRAFAGTYVADLERNVSRMDQMTVLAVIVAVGVGVWTRLRQPRILEGGNPSLAPWAAAVVAVVGVLAWQVRPRLWPAVAGWSPKTAYARAVVNLQAAIGQGADPTRSYSELSVVSIGWYLGAPVVALAIVGFAFVTWRLIEDRSSRFLPAAVLVAVGVPVYLYDMNITPDQLWATRRFVPFVLPCFVIAAVWAADRFVLAVGVARTSRGAMIAALGAALVLPAAATTWPIRELADQRGSYGAMQALCAELGDNAVVLELDGAVFSMPVRAWCHAEVARENTDSTRAVPAFTELSRQDCRRSFLLTAQPTTLEPFTEDLAEVTTFTIVNDRLAEATLIAPPSNYVEQPLTWTLGRIGLPDQCPE